MPPASAPDVLAAPRLAWDDFYARFAGRYRQDEHVSILGPPGTGKTILARELLELRECVIALAVKPEDKIVSSFAGYGYRIQETLEVPTAPDGAGRQVPAPGHRRIVLWPHAQKTGEGRWRTVAQLTAYQRHEILRALDYVRRTTRWALFADDANTLTEREPPALDLGADLKWLWRNGRSAKISLMMAGQRPSWIPRDAYSAPSHLFFFATRDKGDLERLADIGAGLDKRGLEAAIANLPRHEFLYLAPRDYPPTLYRSRVDLKGAR